VIPNIRAIVTIVVQPCTRIWRNRSYYLITNDETRSIFTTKIKYVDYEFQLKPFTRIAILFVENRSSQYTRARTRRPLITRSLACSPARPLVWLVPPSPHRLPSLSAASPAFPLRHRLLPPLPATAAVAFLCFTSYTRHRRRRRARPHRTRLRKYFWAKTRPSVGCTDYYARVRISTIINKGVLFTRRNLVFSFSFAFRFR